MVLVDAATLPSLRERIERAPRVAIDTEFHAERRYLPKLYLVQLHLDDGTSWVIDPLDPSLLAGLAPALLAVPWVVHGGRHDLRVLRPVLGGLPERVWDTQIAAGLVAERFPASFGELQSVWRGVTLEKGETLSDWSRRPLTEEQLRYAVDDVRSLLPLWDVLLARVDDLGRRELLAAACDEARAEVIDPPATDTVWQDIGAASVLSPQQAAVLQELAAWREQEAEATDQPPGAVVATSTLVDLARRQPITLESLAANRRLPKGVVRRHGEALLDSIRRASARPAWAWPHPIPDASPEARRVAWLRCLLQTAGAREAWAASLVAPARILEDLVVRPPASEAALRERLGPWRSALCADLVAGGLGGQLAIRPTQHDLEIVRIGGRAGHPDDDPVGR